MLNERVPDFRAPSLERRELLTQSQCDRIIEFVKTYDPSSPAVEGQPAIWRLPAEETPRLVKYELQDYARRFGIETVSTFKLPVRILRYEGRSETRWHMDYKSESPRKIACVVQLSSERDFVGGIQFAMGDGVTPSLKGKRGEAFLFPGFFPHRVNVESGERWALAAWLTGEWK